MQFLDWLETSSLGLWVAESIWGYPIVLALHAAGMSLVVGLSWMLCARIWGLAETVPISYLLRFRSLAGLGLAVNVASGVALFSGKPHSLWASPPFAIKLGLVATALTLSVLLIARLQRPVPASVGVGLPLVQSPHRALAATVAAFWLAAIIAGRLIAYFEPI